MKKSMTPYGRAEWSNGGYSYGYGANERKRRETRFLERRKLKKRARREAKQEISKFLRFSM